MKYLKKFLYLLFRFVLKIPKTFRRKFWETNLDNKYYGHYNIFIKYIGVYLPYRINGEVQHGWSPYSGLINSNATIDDIKQRRYYLMNESNQINALKKDFKNTIVIGSPFIYLNDMLKNNIEIEEIQKSLLLFPMHSHEWVKFIDPMVSHQSYINEIKKLKSHFNTISVSLGWIEYNNKELVSLFEKENIKVLTMGHRDQNPNFLINFYNQVSKYEYVTSDNFSTAIFYSMFLKKKVFIYGYPINRKNIIRSQQDWYENKWDGPGKDYYDYFSKKYPILLWDNFDHQPHFDIAEEELGTKYKRTPDELRKIFQWSLNDFFQSFIN